MRILGGSAPAAVAMTCLIASAAHSQTQSQTLNIWPGPAPGSEHWTQTEKTFKVDPVGIVVLNVVTPTLTVFLPDRAKAMGT